MTFISFKPKKQMSKFFLFLFFIDTICSCQTQQKFDKENWAEVADLMTFPNRKYMIDDLVKSHRLKGKKYNEIIELLGRPQSIVDSTFELFYDIDVDYRSDIDPVYTKTLSFQFDKDSIVRAFEVREWKKKN